MAAMRVVLEKITFTDAPVRNDVPSSVRHTSICSSKFGKKTSEGFRGHGRAALNWDKGFISWLRKESDNQKVQHNTFTGSKKKYMCVLFRHRTVDVLTSEHGDTWCSLLYGTGFRKIPENEFTRCPVSNASGRGILFI